MTNKSGMPIAVLLFAASLFYAQMYAVHLRRVIRQKNLRYFPSAKTGNKGEKKLFSRFFESIISNEAKKNLPRNPKQTAAQYIVKQSRVRNFSVTQMEPAILDHFTNK